MFGKSIYKIVRPNSLSWKIGEKFDITFDEFVTYIIHLYDRKMEMDEHWQSMSLLCQPCFVEYDFIGKMDSLVEDSNMLLDHLEVNENIRFNNFVNYTLYKVSIKDIAKELYSTVSNEKIKKLYEVYRDDFEAFDYDIPSYINDIILERIKVL